MTDRDDILKHLDQLDGSLREFITNQIVETYKLLTPGYEEKRQELHTHINEVKQSVALVARRVSGDRKPIRCVFLIHMAEAWDTLAPIYEAMAKAQDFQPIVITAMRASPPDWNLGGEEENHRELEKLGVPHLRFTMNDREALDILKALEPDILFRQQPWDKMLPPAFWTSDLTFTRLCYVPYGYLTVRRFMREETNSDEGSSIHHTDQYFHRVCWRIFVETEMHYEMHKRTGTRRGENVVLTGYPKFDKLLERGKSASPFWPIANKDGKKRFRVIWAPHHSIGNDWLNFGTFPAACMEMLDWARKSQDMEFVLKPHPHLWAKIVGTYKVMTVEQLAGWIAAWKSLPNAAIVEGTDYGPLFAASDVMITDGISFFSEYPIFEKPLIYVDSQRHFGFNEAGQALIDASNRVTNVAEAKALCEHLAKGEPDPMRDAQKKMLKRVMPFPGKAAEKILDAIRAGLEQEHGAA